jgi:MFS family permease
LINANVANQEKNAGKAKIGPVVWALGWVSFFTDVSSEMVFPLLPVFLTTFLGAGTAILGLIEGIADSIASVIEIVAGYFSDKTGKRRQLVAIGYGTSSVMKIFIAFSTTWWHVLIARGLERIGKGIRTSPRDAIIAEESSPDVRGKAFGIHRAMDTIGAIIGPLLALLIFMYVGESESGYRTVFMFAIIPAFLAVAVLLLFVREPKATVAPTQKTPFWQAIRQMPQRYMSFLKISLLFSLSYFSFAFFIVRAAELKIPENSIIVLYLMYNVAYAIASVPLGSLSDRIGRIPVIAGSFLLYGLVCIGFALAGTFEQLAVLFVVYGIFVSADESVNKAYISDLIGEERRGTALGAYNTAVGVAYLPASIVAGAVWAAFGAPAAFVLAAGVALLSGVVLAINSAGR